jgi:hypothetical protein
MFRWEPSHRYGMAEGHAEFGDIGVRGHTHEDIDLSFAAGHSLPVRR